MQVDFYHLTTTPLDRALPQIAQKVLESGNRLLIVSESEDQRAQVDTLLWTYTPDSFLPHARAGTGDDTAQPVLIAGTASGSPNNARYIALIDGVWREDALAYARAFHFFDADRIQDARAAWKGLADRVGLERRYWKQDDAGRWSQAG